MIKLNSGSWEENAKFVLEEISSGKESRRALHAKVDKISDELFEVRTMLKLQQSSLSSIIKLLIERFLK